MVYRLVKTAEGEVSFSGAENMPALFWKIQLASAVGKSILCVYNRNGAIFGERCIGLD